MAIIFPAEPFQPKRIDPDYAREGEAAHSAGLRSHLIDFEALLEGEARRAVSRIPAGDGGLCVYRGWMMTPDRYEDLASALAAIGWRIMTSPAEYRRAHHLPLAYDWIRGATPETVWTTNIPPSRDDLRALLTPFASRPIVVKDFVKSRKHEWDEAFFIPAADDLDAVQRVTGTFLKRQGSDLAGGLVFREFVPLAGAGRHPQSDITLSREYRAFVVKGEMILAARYWDEAQYDEIPPYAQFLPMVKDLSPFFSLDIALAEDGRWLIIEVGDGQVSGLADSVDLSQFYEALARHLVA